MRDARQWTIAQWTGRALALGLLLSPVVASAQADTTTVPPWRAIGHEPSWSLMRTADALTLETDFGTSRISVPLPKAVTLNAATTRYSSEFRGQNFVVTVSKAVCLDSMTGMPRPDRVTVVIGEKRLKGCGGDPALLLAQREWNVVKLGAKALLTGTKITLAFAKDGSVSGSSSCNRFYAAYEITGEKLTLKPGLSSMMACEPKIMAQEARFREALEQVTRFSLTPDGELLLGSTSDFPVLKARPTASRPKNG